MRWLEAPRASTTMNKSSAHIVQPSPVQWVFQKIYITSNKCFSSTAAEPGRGPTLKVRETLMRQDYHDGMTLTAVSHSVAKETVSHRAQRVPSAARRRTSGWVAAGTSGCRCHSGRHHVLSFVPFKELEISENHKIHFVSSLVSF